MITKGTFSQPVWRIAPMGTTQVYLAGFTADGTQARVHSRGQIMTWAKKPMLVSPADLFLTRKEAREEYRRRHRAALQADPYASRDVTTREAP